jgi:ketosteroid isomerase-like protein
VLRCQNASDDAGFQDRGRSAARILITQLREDICVAIPADLQLLADREAIKELTARYARCVVTGDGRGVGALYSEDGRFVAGKFDCIGRANIQDLLETQIKPGKNMPLVTDHIIEIDGDTASCYSIMFTPWFRHKQPGFCGAYTDKLRKVDGEWYFVERAFEFFEGRPEDS